MASSWSSSPDYAGFWPRAGALVIDWLVVVVTTGPIVVVHAWGFVMFLIIAAAVVAFWHHFGATPGKIAFGLKIVDAASGEPPTLGRLLIRFLAYFVSAAPLYLGFLWAAVDRRKQGWHDKIAGTVVVNSED